MVLEEKQKTNPQASCIPSILDPWTSRGPFPCHLSAGTHPPPWEWHKLETMSPVKRQGTTPRAGALSHTRHSHPSLTVYEHMTEATRLLRASLFIAKRKQQYLTCQGNVAIEQEQCTAKHGVRSPEEKPPRTLGMAVQGAQHMRASVPSHFSLSKWEL